MRVGVVGERRRLLEIVCNCNDDGLIGISYCEKTYTAGVSSYLNYIMMI